ncbi:AAA family ATPase [Algirhabdus cladophorae]|uniref:AAA family ATPase n=1 Tax=Algirhabdus cladophorae TaxID=3377108 RepID=UPI003B84B2EE
MSVQAVLMQAGLDQYLGQFEENDIDLPLAIQLTDTDLKEIGITSLGHRRKLLAAFAGPHGHDAVIERRDVVITFVDLVDFTTLIQGTDPEDAYAVIQAFLNLVDEEVRASGGTVERHLGDAVMGVFGAPFAMGNEALRAVEFAAGLHQRVAELGRQYHQALKIRIGVAYGRVIMRQAQGEDISVVGASVNLAARLCSEAQAGQTLLSSDVTAACGRQIDVGPAQVHQLKGFDEPMKSFALQSYSAADTQTLVGRTAQITSFADALQRTRDTGCGQLVVLRGEAGIGKSTVLRQWLSQARLAGFGHHVAHIQNFGAAQTRETRAKIVAQIGPRAELAPEQMLWLLWDPSRSISDNDSTVVEAASPEAQMQNRRLAFEAMMTAACAHDPLVLAFEDAHWADAEMLTLLAECCALAQRIPLIVVATSRLEGDQLDATWLSQIAPTKVSAQTLTPLDTQDCRALASAVLGDDQDAHDAIARSGGHPLYLEQLLRHGQENAKASLPHSIHTIIQARLDLLDQQHRRAARAAAVLGQRLDLEALRTVLRMPQYDPGPLIDRRILRFSSNGLAFHHALIRDCVYKSVLREERTEFHQAAAEWFAPRDLALRAEHLAQANDPHTPSAYLEAAQQASAAWHYADAAHLCTSGLHHSPDPDLRAQLLIAQAAALFQHNQPEAALNAYQKVQTLTCRKVFYLEAALGEITALRLVDRVQEAQARIDAARALAETGTHDRVLSHLHYLQGALLFPTGDFEASLASHDKALNLARRVNDPERIADALSGRGDALYAQGRMAMAGDVFGSCLDLCEQHGLMRIKAQNLFMRGTVRIYALDWEGALEDALQSAGLAKAIGNARAEVVSRLTAAWVYAWTGDLEGAKIEAQTGLDVATTAGAIRFKPFLSEALGHALLLSGERPAAITCLTQAAKDMREVGAQQFIGPWILGSLALALGPCPQQTDLLAEAEEILQNGAIGHNHFQFRRLAIDAAIEAGDRQAALAQAQRLETFTKADPTPWSDQQIARARDFAARAQVSPK